MSRKISIAIDGPAGSGKSTVAKLVAEQFGYIYIDTGAMYRALTLKALRNALEVTDEHRLTIMAETTEIGLGYRFSDGAAVLHVIVDGEDVSEAIRNFEVTEQVSKVAAVSGVRQALVAMQQNMAKSGGVVMDGRDIGTVVLPMAELKIFLTASVAERGRRRWLELKEKGMDVDLEELIRQIEKRDYLDSHREVHPLCRAEDAVLLDTTVMDIQGVVARICELALAKGAVKLDSPKSSANG